MFIRLVLSNIQIKNFSKIVFLRMISVSIMKIFGIVHVANIFIAKGGLITGHYILLHLELMFAV